MNKVNLPVLGALRPDETTYITFSKANLDLDKSIANDTPYYFTKMVGIKIPNWNETKFYKHPTINPNITGINSNNPNFIIPEYFARYMENIIRQEIDSPHITEIAFWKTMEILHRNNESIYSIIGDMVKTINDVVVSDFYELKNNNGWGKLIGQIPPGKKQLSINTKAIDIQNIQTNDEQQDLGLYDDSNRRFTMQYKSFIIDFETTAENEYGAVNGANDEFGINAVLLFYRDADGVDKLHGINFLNPFENKASHYELKTYPLSSNHSFGYQFIFNIKTCNNEASIQKVLENNEHLNWWNGFETMFQKLNKLLELKINEAERHIVF